MGGDGLKSFVCLEDHWDLRVDLVIKNIFRGNKDMMKRLATLCLGVGLATTLACVPGEIEDKPEELDSTGLNLTIDIQGKTDVAGVRYEISKCGKKNQPFVEVTKDLEDLTLPGAIPGFVNNPFDSRSQHLFADYFTVLKPGCYDVKATPVQSNGYPSEKCRKVMAKGVEVNSGVTTEILLVSQCTGVDTGALDVVTALNHPPKIKKLTYNPSKFVKCNKYGFSTVTLCATAEDPNKDPMTFEWNQLAGPYLFLGPRVIFSFQKKGVKTECVRIHLRRPIFKQEDYLFEVIVRDQFHGEQGLQTAEEWFYENGYGTVKSRATLAVPVYLSCPLRKKYTPPHDGDGDGDGDGNGDGDGDNGVEPIDTCPRTQGFWGNNLQRWPEGAASTVLYSGTTWQSVLMSGSGGDMCSIMGQQYVAAQLNVGVGALGPADIDDLFEEAEGIFANSCPGLTGGSGAVRDRAEELKDIFESLNEGDFEGSECIDIEDLDNGDGDGDAIIL